MLETTSPKDDTFGQVFGPRLAAARKAAGLTQEELGVAVGLGKGAISSWETGRTQPDACQVAAISLRLGVSADHLLYGKAAAEAKAA